MSVTAEFAFERLAVNADRRQLRRAVRKDDIIAEDIVFVPVCAAIADSLEIVRLGDKGVNVPVRLVVRAEVVLLNFINGIRFAYAIKARKSVFRCAEIGLALFRFKNARAFDPCVRVVKAGIFTVAKLLGGQTDCSVCAAALARV